MKPELWPPEIAASQRQRIGASTQFHAEHSDRILMSSGSLRHRSILLRGVRRVRSTFSATILLATALALALLDAAAYTGSSIDEWEDCENLPPLLNPHDTLATMHSQSCASPRHQSD